MTAILSLHNGCPSPGRGMRVSLAVFTLLSAIATAPAPAATLRSSATTTTVPRRLYAGSGVNISADAEENLLRFLAGGPDRWAKTAAPHFPSGLVIAHKDGTLRNTIVNQYFYWKRSQNTSQWDSRHPTMAPLFQQYDKNLAAFQAQYIARAISQPSRSAAFQVLVPPTTTAATGVTAGTTAGSTGTTSPVAQVMPQPVPEPASVVSTLGLFGIAGGWWARGRRQAR